MSSSKKIDQEAVLSSFMHVPNMPVKVARWLLDAGYHDLFELQGRSAESLFREIQKVDFMAESKIALPALRLAIYYYENRDCIDRKLISLSAWRRSDD
ncbi:MAG: helix-hairpin-helix domain-containing protein [Opitutales bacterium]|nr:helix-hairpin-helix domain-containing protein [Opitutales bacterium]